MTPKASLGVLRQMPLTAHWLLSSATRSNGDIDWPVHSSILSFREMWCIPFYLFLRSCWCCCRWWPWKGPFFIYLRLISVGAHHKWRMVAPIYSTSLCSAALQQIVIRIAINREAAVCSAAHPGCSRAYWRTIDWYIKYIIIALSLSLSSYMKSAPGWDEHRVWCKIKHGVREVE